MKYLVMECHPGYAVVMDQEGRFLQVANQQFEVGQTVSQVVKMQEGRPSPSAGRILRNLAAAAACLCLLILGTWNALAPYGTVRMQINPDVKLSVNRMDYVIRIIPLNKDAQVLLDGYKPGIQKIDKVLDELADRALAMGYLSANGDIQVSVESSHREWQTSTQDRLIAELELHMGGTVTVVPNPAPIPAEKDFDDSRDPRLTMEEAKQLAFRHLGVTDSSKLLDESYDYENGIFELEFIFNGISYEFKIDAYCAEILEIEQEPLEDEDDPDDPDPDEDDPDEDDPEEDEEDDDEPDEDEEDDDDPDEDKEDDDDPDEDEEDDDDPDEDEEDDDDPDEDEEDDDDPEEDDDD